MYIYSVVSRGSRVTVRPWTIMLSVSTWLFPASAREKHVHTLSWFRHHHQNRIH